jgi:hypothetical protein
MLSPKDYLKHQAQNEMGSSVSTGFISEGFDLQHRRSLDNTNPSIPGNRAVPQLMLYNDSLNIRLMGINGAIIGRRQGPYVQQLQQQMYISGVHAQLKYNAQTGWCIADKHSSNGTKLNNHKLQPDVEMSMKNGDLLSIANIVLQVSIK